MTADPVDPSGWSDALWSELATLPADHRVTRVGPAWRILTPSNPTFRWGNALRFDGPPGPNDFTGWTRLAERCVRKLQPRSVHAAFAWDGPDRGAIEPFVEAGFAYSETVRLAVDRSRPVTVPSPLANTSGPPIMAILPTGVVDAAAPVARDGGGRSGRRRVRGIPGGPDRRVA